MIRCNIVDRCFDGSYMYKKKLQRGYSHIYNTRTTKSKCLTILGTNYWETIKTHSHLIMLWEVSER